MNKWVLGWVLVAFLSGCGMNPEGETMETQEAAPEASASGKEYVIEPERSGIQWMGAKITGKHEGTVSIQEGEFWVKDGELTAGRIVTDMNSITVNDLEGKDKEDLETHLKDTDFFESHEFPTGKLVITEVMPAKEKEFTHEISANLTLKGITRRITFPAVLDITEDSLIGNASFTIDRSQWGIVYKGRLDNAIRDEISLSVMVQAHSGNK